MRELVREQSNYGTNVVATWTEQVKSMLRIHQHQRWQYEHFIDTCTSTIIKHKSTGGSKTQKLMTGRIPTYASNSWTTRYNSTRGGHRKGSLWYLIKKRFTSCQLNISAHRGRQGERSGKLALVAAHLEKLSRNKALGLLLTQGPEEWESWSRSHIHMEQCSTFRKGRKWETSYRTRMSKHSWTLTTVAERSLNV